jgi:hypothetical protein
MWLTKVVGVSNESLWGEQQIMTKPHSPRTPRITEDSTVTAAPGTKADQLTIRFVRQLPNEEVVFYARRCAQKSEIPGPLTIVLESKSSAGEPMHEVRLEQDGAVVVSESDPEILLAVRNAFDRLAMSYVQLPPSHLFVASGPGEPSSKIWS